MTTSRSTARVKILQKKLQASDTAYSILEQSIKDVRSETHALVAELRARISGLQAQLELDRETSKP